MSQPGWYPDPYGTASLRWWDGQNWTRHVNPRPPESARPYEPGRGALQTAPAAYAAPLDVNLRGVPLHADDDVISYGADALAWSQVEWVAYWTTGMPAADPGAASAVVWVLQVGRHPFRGGPRVEVVLDSTLFPEREAEAIWTRLVDRCRRRAEPRLVAELAGRVRAGHPVDVAEGLTVHPGGVRGTHVSLSWAEISGAVVDAGRVWIQQSDGGTPVLYVPRQNPNAVLIPELLAALRPTRYRPRPAGGS
ncbi:DUF2510 domain-containing protein [Actinomadura sp. NPDC047616]|uniref:DUF2510 domain-containing protein n=1 Tax=Actinomadura sp. NPDC047616 TaxID=3155914 RepID=UPI0033E8DFC8